MNSLPFLKGTKCVTRVQPYHRKGNQHEHPGNRRSPTCEWGEKDSAGHLSVAGDKIVQGEHGPSHHKGDQVEDHDAAQKGDGSGKAEGGPYHDHRYDHLQWKDEGDRKNRPQVHHGVPRPERRRQQDPPPFRRLTADGRGHSENPPVDAQVEEEDHIGVDDHPRSPFSRKLGENSILQSIFQSLSKLALKSYFFRRSMGKNKTLPASGRA